MYIQIITNNVKEGEEHLTAYIEASKAFMADIAAAPGNLGTSVYVNEDKKVVNIVSWEKKGDESVVFSAGILQKHVEALAPHIDGNTTLELFSV